MRGCSVKQAQFSEFSVNVLRDVPHKRTKITHLSLLERIFAGCKIKDIFNLVFYPLSVVQQNQCNNSSQSKRTQAIQ